MTAPLETPPKASTSTTSFWKRSALAIGGVILFHAFFDIPGFFYENRGWDIPRDPVEKAAYDYAHSLKLPDSVPQEALYFPFWWARIVALIPGAPSVDEAYFRHLCEYEAGDYVFKRVENVEGVFQLRPREAIYGMPINYDRYRLEEPTGVGSGDSNTRSWKAAESLVQPSIRVYEFLEKPSYEHEGAVVRYMRGRNDHPPTATGTVLRCTTRSTTCVALLSSWVRRKLRCYLWKQWGSSGYRQLRQRGISVREAWNTSKSAHGPCRLSTTQALSITLPLRFFETLGLPSLAPR